MTKSIFAFAALAALSMVGISSLTGRSFWRCGVEFPPDPEKRIVPISMFDEEQWGAIVTDPSLRVVPVDADALAADEIAASDSALESAIITAIDGLTPQDFDAKGKPKVEALKAALPELADQINAGVRDDIWAGLRASVELEQPPDGKPEAEPGQT